MTNNAIDKLKIPGIGLIISGALNGFSGVALLISGLARFSSGKGKENIPTETGELVGYLIGTFGIYGVGFLSMAVSPIIIFGGTRLLKGQSRGLVIAAAILSILPLTSCCFMVSIIFGVWALVVLRNHDVKILFQNDGVIEVINSSHPPPPPNW